MTEEKGAAHWSPERGWHNISEEERVVEQGKTVYRLTGKLPEWAQQRKADGLCAMIDGWCVTHDKADDPGHWYATRPAGADTGD